MSNNNDIEKAVVYGDSVKLLVKITTLIYKRSDVEIKIAEGMPFPLPEFAAFWSKLDIDFSQVLLGYKLKQTVDRSVEISKEGKDGLITERYVIFHFYINNIHKNNNYTLKTDENAEVSEGDLVTIDIKVDNYLHDLYSLYEVKNDDVYSEKILGLKEGKETMFIQKITDANKYSQLTGEDEEYIVSVAKIFKQGDKRGLQQEKFKERMWSGLKWFGGGGGIALLVWWIGGGLIGADWTSRNFGDFVESIIMLLIVAGIVVAGIALIYMIITAIIFGIQMLRTK